MDMCSKCPEPLHAKGFCRNHYSQHHYQQNKEKRANQTRTWREANKDKAVSYIEKYKASIKQTECLGCGNVGCTQIGFCRPCQYQMHQLRDLKTIPARVVVKICKLEHCESAHYGKDLCHTHYNQVYEDQAHRREIRRRQSQLWRINHPGEGAKYGNRYQQRLRDAKQGLLLPKEIRRLTEALCFYCGATARTLDHVVPLIRGGNHTVGNLVAACKSCNSRKQRRTIMEWRIANKRMEAAR